MRVTSLSIHTLFLVFETALEQELRISSEHKTQPTRLRDKSSAIGVKLLSFCLCLLGQHHFETIIRFRTTEVDGLS